MSLHFMVRVSEVIATFDIAEVLIYANLKYYTEDSTSVNSYNTSVRHYHRQSFPAYKYLRDISYLKGHLNHPTHVGYLF